jgi:KRAB domain-containing zinc finger protein
LCNGDKDISRRSPESETSGSNGKIRSEGDLSIFCCKFCGLQLSCRKDLRQHHKQEHGPQKSEFSKKKSRTKGSILLTAPVVTSKEDSIFQCEYCAKSFNCVGGLSKHLKIHSGLKPYTCPVCGKSFLHSAHLKNHMRIHTGEKPYQCDACGKSFKQSQHLKDHKRSVHSTLHQCALCERTFASRQELASHRRLHSGERVYVCAVCERPFSRNQLLKDHMRIHTGERPFGCQLCDKTFIQKPHLTRHIRLYH